MEPEDRSTAFLPTPATLLFEVTIPGDPVPWAPKQTNRNTGNRFIAGRQAEAISRALAAVERIVEERGGMEAVRIPPGLALRMEARFYVKRPKGHYGTGRNEGVLKGSAPQYPTGRPDYSNLLKLVEDCLTLSGVLPDDDQIIGPTGNCGKLYAGFDEVPRSVIRLYAA